MCRLGTPLDVSRTGAVNNPNAAAILLTENVWPGWRFEITTDVAFFRVTDVGYQGAFTSAAIFAAIVALDGPNDQPDALDLSGNDVVATAILNTLPINGDADVVIPLSTTLTPGSYAVIFGSNAFGATGGDGRIRDGQTTVPGSQLPFAIRQDTNTFQLQGIEARMFVRGFAF